MVLNYFQNKRLIYLKTIFDFIVVKLSLSGDLSGVNAIWLYLYELFKLRFNSQSLVQALGDRFDLISVVDYLYQICQDLKSIWYGYRKLFEDYDLRFQKDYK